MSNKQSIYVRLAKEALETYILERKTIEIPAWVTENMRTSKNGVFVSIKRRGALRGCMGTLKSVTESTAEEIISNAITAATRDPRFPVVIKEELESLEYSVDVLGTPELIDSINDLDPKKYGIIVSKGYKVGVLLPNLENIDTVEKQIKIALSKAGIYSYEDYYIERFEVERYT